MVKTHVFDIPKSLTSPMESKKMLIFDKKFFPYEDTL